MKVLITDSKQRKTFDIISILKSIISPKDLIITNDNNSIFSFIVYRKKSLLLRNSSYDLFKSDLSNILLKFPNEEIIYIPIEENTTLIFYKFIEKNKLPNLKFLLQDLQSFELAINKLVITKFCLKNDIPAPRYFNKKQVLLSLEEKYFIPVICKPRIGSGAKGIISITSPQEVDKLALFDESKYVIQELLPNGKDVYGTFFLMNKGEVISVYGHRRLRTFPFTGGVTVYSKIEMNKKTILLGSQLLKKLNWSGFAMVEFLWDPEIKSYKVIEINPRLWGSILLSEFSGASFFINYINICLGNITVPVSIKSNSKIRWFLFDLLNLFRTGEIIRDFWMFNKKETCYINVTYADWLSIFLFHLYFIYNTNNISTFFKKWKKK